MRRLFEAQRLLEEIRCINKFYLEVHCFLNYINKFYLEAHRLFQIKHVTSTYISKTFLLLLQNVILKS